MARGKKAAKALTPEERLEQALVPVEEQPYPIPENWCWVTIGAIASVKGGKRIPKGNKLVEYKTDHPYIRVTDFDNRSIATEQVKYIDEETFKLIRNYTISTQDIYISIAGTIGKVGIIPDDLDGANLTENAAKITNIRGVEKNFLLWLLESEVAQSQMRDATISTTQPKLALFRIENVKFPLSPLTEQQRIVSRIESLFAKLDEAKEKAQAVVDSFELRKSAILHKAFTGELTELWRKENGRSDDDWRVARFDEVAEIKSNLVNPADYQDFPHIAPDNVEKRTGVLLEYHTIAEDGVKSGKHLFHAGQILYSKIRPNLSKVVIVGFDGLCSADMYPIDAKGNVRYLWYYMLSDEFLEQASNAGSRSVLPKINQKELSKVMVRITSLEEQQKIARILDDIFNKEQQAKETAEAALSQIDTMKKAILARAFRGELGTNDPAEEWAGELVIKMI